MAGAHQIQFPPGIPITGSLEPIGWTVHHGLKFRSGLLLRQHESAQSTDQILGLPVVRAADCYIRRTDAEALSQIDGLRWVAEWVEMQIRDSVVNHCDLFRQDMKDLLDVVCGVLGNSDDVAGARRNTVTGLDY